MWTMIDQLLAIKRMVIRKQYSDRNGSLKNNDIHLDGSGSYNLRI